MLESPCRLFVTGCVLRELRRLRAEERRENAANGTSTNEFGRLVHECAKEHCLKCAYATSSDDPRRADEAERGAGAGADADADADDGEGGSDAATGEEEDERDDDDEEGDDDDADGLREEAAAAAPDDERDRRRRERQRRRKREKRQRLREEREERERRDHVSGAACILGRVEAATAHLRPAGAAPRAPGGGVGRCLGGAAGTSAKEVFFVATQDRQLKALLRLVPGVPIITVTAAGHVILEEPSPEQLAAASASESSRRGVSQHEGATHRAHAQAPTGRRPTLAAVAVRSRVH